MKNIISLSLFIQLLFLTGTNAQIKPIEELGNIYPKANIYFKDINLTLNKFIGTWEYSTSNNYFKIRFFKVENVQSCNINNKYYFKDELRSFVQYKVFENGVWVEKYNTFPQGMQQPVTIHLPSCEYNGTHGGSVINNNILILTYEEPTESCYRTKKAFLTLKYINNLQLEWKYDTKYAGRGIPTDTPCDGGGVVDSSPLIVPNTMTLTKVQ